jgi:branched-chain amino acid transport system substrate-binding protein
MMRDGTGFLKGVKMAVAEVNTKSARARRGAVRMTIRVADDQANFMEGIRIAQNLAVQPDITAVIGHWNSSIAIPAARIYNDAGLLMLSPVVSNPELTSKGYGYVFRNTLSDTEMGRQLAEYAARMNYRRVVIDYADNEYGMALANAFEDALSRTGGKVIDRVTDFNNALEFNEALDKWKALDYDAIFVADSMPHAAAFIRQMRQADKRIPMFGGDGLDVTDFLAKLGTAAEGVVVATVFNPEERRTELQKFIAAYRRKYAAEPDVWAILGYDSIQLIASAVQKAGSASPRKIAAALHGMKGWSGVLGTLRFDAAGEMRGIAIFKKIVRGGRFEYLPD